jgi:predicted DNA-binding transcriptional regulator YafY
MSGSLAAIANKKALTVVGSLLLGWVSYVSVTAINNHARISALAEKQASDDRQDVELREIRRTLQDMTVLFFQLDSESEDAVVEELEPLLAMPALEFEPTEMESFNAAQMAIEDLVQRKGGQR